MGLLDVLNGMAHGPRGQPQPSVPGSGGMSKTTMALLALLAYKAYKSMTAQPEQSPRSASHYPSNERNGSKDSNERRLDDRYGPSERAGRSVPDAQYSPPPTGGFRDLLRSIIGGGPVPGSVVSRGVENTVRDLEDSGQADIARSWVGRGPNRPITPAQLASALGEDATRELMDQTGMERNELLEILSEHLPRVIDHLTPTGRVPTPQEATRMT